jgi:hypothetical protein
MNGLGWALKTNCERSTDATTGLRPLERFTLRFNAVIIHCSEEVRRKAVARSTAAQNAQVDTGIYISNRVRILSVLSCSVCLTQHL